MMPELEGVVVLGMHRSGTSLVTRLINLLGLSVCRRDDLIVGREANPLGHWESKVMVDFNDRLLRELDSTWHCPPVLGSAEALRIRDRGAFGALAALRSAHPDRPFVWKDPRISVLMPFWSKVLEHRVAYVIVVRHPLEVSESLEKRNRFGSPLGLALWERYTREAMLGAAGRPVLLSTYEEVLAEPTIWCRRLLRFMADLGFQTRGVDESAVEAVATSDLRHAARSWTDLRGESPLSAQQVALADAARVTAAQTKYVPPTLPPETTETESIFEQIRRHNAHARSGTPSLRTLPPELLRPAGSTARTGQSLRPPISVILARDDASIDASISKLVAALPAASEILIVGADRSDGEQSSRSGIFLRQIRCDGRVGVSGALALGVKAARGDIALLDTREIGDRGSFYEDISKGLRGARVAGVGPSIRLSSRPDQSYFGRSFCDDDLSWRFVPGVATGGLVPVALLFESLCAFKREVLVAAGGLDEDFGSVSYAIAELSLRLWRMGFRCCVVPRTEVWIKPEEADVASEEEYLHDRLRIATLHFGPARLQTFTDRASRHRSYAAAVERLNATDVQRRRAAIDAICAFSTERYFDDFPLRSTRIQSAWRRAERSVVRRGQGSSVIRTLNRISKRARIILSRRLSPR